MAASNSQIQTQHYQYRCPAENHRAEFVGQKADFKAGKQRYHRQGIQHQEAQAVDGFRNRVGVIYIGNRRNKYAHKNKCSPLVDPLHGYNALIFYFNFTEFGYDRPGGEQVGDSPEDQEKRCEIKEY